MSAKPGFPRAGITHGEDILLGCQMDKSYIPFITGYLSYFQTCS